MPIYSTMDPVPDLSIERQRIAELQTLGIKTVQADHPDGPRFNVEADSPEGAASKLKANAVLPPSLAELSEDQLVDKLRIRPT